MPETPFQSDPFPPPHQDYGPYPPGPGGWTGPAGGWTGPGGWAGPGPWGHPGYRRGCAGRWGGGPVHRLLRAVLIWVVVAGIAMLALGAVGWAVGLAFHLIGLLFRIALLTVVATFLWRRITSRYRGSSGT